MTHQLLVDLSNKLDESSRLSVCGVRRFAQLVIKDYPAPEALAFRLVLRTYTLEGVRQISIACKLLCGRVLRGTAQ